MGFSETFCHAESSVQRAISSCKGDSSKVIHATGKAAKVTESSKDSYCNVSSRVGELDHIGEYRALKNRIHLNKVLGSVGTFRVYATKSANIITN